ncbi:putative sulfate transporter 3.5 -like protein [Gossypium arboreum]|uniref:Putative sulfate transporter 3.5-like protein n=1 Tax=Gossypium arboreum TaxID=29729 RepID=A0A0B0N763_GOSAR|nr:putative sulfate transporter 3.5 -like protein [Gossypium arboreum]
MANPSRQAVNFAAPRGFATAFKADCKETFFPDDPFHEMKHEKPLNKLKKTIQYFIPLFEWLPNYNLRLFRYDLLAGITITSLAIPQGISYAKLAKIPPIYGLYSSFIPPFVYAIFGSSKHLAVGTVAACSLLLSETVGAKASPQDDPTLLGILVDFLSHSTITGFMGGTAIIICLQQLKGIFGLVHFTTHTDVVSVLGAVFRRRNEWRWESAVVGIIFLAFLQFTRYLRQKRPKLFWVSAIAPMVVVVVGCLFAFFAHAEKHGIQIVGELKKGLNPPSIQYLNFDPQYLPVTVRAGLITGLIAMAEGIAIGRSFAIMKSEQTDGNKEMIAFGFMNIIGSFTSCYLTTGPFSKTAVNFNAGCRTAMSNVVMGFCMMLTLLFLAPLFRYTPLVALSAIIMSAMLGLINYDEMIHLFKVDKFDFVICMAAFLGVSFISMDVGLMLSVGLALLRALLYVARPAACKLGKIPNSSLYRDAEQYPGSTPIQGALVLQLGSPIYFANSTYIRERVLRYIKEEQGVSDSKTDIIEHLLLDLSGVSSIDMTGIETFLELRRILDSKGIKLSIVNPRIEVLEKMTLAKFTDAIGKESFYLSIEDAVQNCRFSLHSSKTTMEESLNDQNVV